MQLNQEFLTLVNAPIRAVFNEIAYDLEEACNSCGERLCNEGAIEACIDADRLSFSGYKEADEAVKEVLKTNTYEATMKFLKKNIILV